MAEIFVGLMLAAVATIAIAYAIKFFWQIGIKDSLIYAAFFICIIVIFWLSGLWEDAQPHSWGTLTPIFAVLMLAAWLFFKIGCKLWRKWRDIYRKTD